MSQIQKTKIQNIGRVSRALLWLITPINVLIYLIATLLIALLCFVPSGTLSITDLIIAMVDRDEFIELIKDKGLLVSTRFFGITLVIYLLIPFTFILKHLKQVLQCFHRGDIFNATALTHARKAYSINLFIAVSWIAFHFLCITLAMFIKNQFEVDYITNWTSDSASALVEVAISTLLIWAFELGTDLNEEAELTI